MHSALLQIGPFTLHSYGLMMALSFLSAMWIMRFADRAAGRPLAFYSDIVFWLIVAGLLGARAAYVIENWREYAANPLTIFFVHQGGLVFYGGFVGATLAMLVFARRHSLSLLALTDLIVVSLPFAHALGRIGCFLHGCCYGRRLAGWPGVCFPYGSLPWEDHVDHGWILPQATRSLPVHPVQLYEALFNLLLFGLVLRLYGRRRRRGRVTGVYLVCYAVGRFLLEFLRGDHAAGHLTPAQWIGLLLLPLGLVFLFRRNAAAVTSDGTRPVAGGSVSCA